MHIRPIVTPLRQHSRIPFRDAAVPCANTIQRCGRNARNGHRNARTDVFRRTMARREHREILVSRARTGQADRAARRLGARPRLRTESPASPQAPCRHGQDPCPFMAVDCQCLRHRPLLFLKQNILALSIENKTCCPTATSRVMCQGDGCYPDFRNSARVSANLTIFPL